MPLLRLLPFIKDNEVNGKICDDLFAKGVRTEEDLMWKEELIDIAFSRNIPYKVGKYLANLALEHFNWPVKLRVFALDPLRMERVRFKQVRATFTKRPIGWWSVEFGSASNTIGMYSVRQ